MAFLDETGLNYFKSKNDETYASKTHTHNYAGSSSAGGPATSANKLNTNAGGVTTPAYFSDGIPVACTPYSNASVKYATSAGTASTANSVVWDNVSGKPSFSTVATSGSYNDLSNRPTIPSVGNGTVTITQNGVSKGSFTLNQSGNATIALTDTDTNTTYSAISSTDINALFA